MEKMFVTALTVVLTVTACGNTDGTSSPSASPETTQARAELTVSDEASCQTLLGDDGGLVSDSGRFLTDVKDLSDSSAKEAEGIATALDGVAKTAGDELEKLLVVMQEPFKDLADAHKNGTSFQLDPARFKAAANEVITICDEALGGATPPGTALAPAPDAQPTPAQGVPTSGNYAADLASHGMVPDDLNAYKTYMQETLCDSDLGDRLRGFYAEVRSLVPSPPDPQSDQADQLRVNVAYLCPDRVNDLEEALTELASE